MELYVVIAGCEIAFWSVLVGGLLIRYALGWRRVSTVLLALVPAVDAVLLLSAAVDLRRGGTATLAHALAAIFISFSVVYGKTEVARLDRWMRRRFRRGPADTQPATPLPAAGSTVGEARSDEFDWEHAAGEREGWYRHATMWVVGVALLGAGVLFVGDLERTRRLTGVASAWTVVLAVDFLISFSYTLFPRRAPGRHRAPARRAASES